MPYLAGFATPQDYGAVGNGTADDTTAIQNAINAVSAAGGGALFFPAASYKISSALTLASYVELRGMGSGVSVINQSSTTANGLYGLDLTNVKVTGLSVNGPGSGSGIGLNLDLSVNNDNTYAVVDDVRVASFGSHGIQIKSPETCRFSRVNVTANGADAWHIYGTGTSSHWSACYALNNASGIGYHLIGLSYSSLSGCAADSNADGYSLSGCTDVALTGCGTESNSVDGYILSGGSGNSLTSCFIFANNHYGVHVTGSEASATITGFVEHGPTGSAVNSIITDSGTSAVAVNPTIITATSYAAGTATQVSTNATAVNASVAGGAVSVTNGTAVTGTNTADFLITESLSTSRAFGTKVAGDTELRYYLNAKGDANYGAGASTDFQLLRIATGVLGATKSFQVGNATDIGSNGVGVLKYANAGTPPTTNPTGGAVAYATAGQLLARNPQGLVQTLSSVIQVQTSTTTVTGVTAETVLHTVTIPANDPAAGAVYHLTGYGTFTAASGTLVWTVRWGGTAGTSIAALPANTAPVLTNGLFWYDVTLTFRSTTSVTAAINLEIGSSTTTDAATSYIGTPTAATAVTTTGSTALTVDVTPSISGDTINLLGGCARRLA